MLARILSFVRCAESRSLVVGLVILTAWSVGDAFAGEPEPESHSKREPPEVPPGTVVAALFGPVADHSSITPDDRPARLTWHQDAMAFAALPNRYVDGGIRGDWTEGNRQAMVLRAWTHIDLPAGDYQVLLRSRGKSRLRIDGQTVVETPTVRRRAGAHNVVRPLPEVPVPGMRPHFMNDHERVVDFHSDGGTHTFDFEAVVGGRRYRLGVGETCVAIARDDEMFRLVSPAIDAPLTDEGWNVVADRQAQTIDDLDTRQRRAASAPQDAYWNERHEFTRRHRLRGDASESIDAVIGDAIDVENERRATRSADHSKLGDLYHAVIEPAFSRHCARCHADKQQGEFSIRSRVRLLAGGESGEPAIVPGDVDASYLYELVSAGPDDYRMPPQADGFNDTELAALERWIDGGAPIPEPARQPIRVTETVDDGTFLRRIYLDTVGVPPTLDEARAFLDDPAGDKRDRLIDRLLGDDRWADNWVGYWQDVFAENPNLLKPTLNNTGPFRFWIHEALRDNKPVDRFATELMMMRGSKWYGGAAGFAVASQNDVPMAAKAHVIATAFLGVEMKCARCHDAPYHPWKQRDLFELAAMLRRDAIELPASSTVPPAFFENKQRESLIEVTLTPGAAIQPRWPFGSMAEPVPESLLRKTDDPRERLAVRITASRRFAEVIANRIWKRLIGRGVVEPVDDWWGHPTDHPALLTLLADKLIALDYDVRAFSAEIFRSEVYRRACASDPDARAAFAGPTRRRMTAEQIVDSALHVAGMPMMTEQLTMDIEGVLPAHRFMDFGYPRRAWELTTLANERDRPSLALPKTQAVTDVLTAFGWRNSRPEPTSQRDEAPNLIQPGVLANGTLGVWLTRLSDESSLAAMFARDVSLDRMIDNLFLRFLTRLPSDDERRRFTGLLADGFDDRLREEAETPRQAPRRYAHVSWSNHLDAEANRIKVAIANDFRQGPTPTSRLADDWRTRAEDAVWALLNSPEMILLP